MRNQYIRHKAYSDSILIKKYDGTINGNIVINSMENLKVNNLINTELKGLIYDISDCKMNVDSEGFKAVVNYLQNQEYIDSIKIAVIAITPENIIFPVLLAKEKIRDLRMKPFSTWEAAADWIMFD